MDAKATNSCSKCGQTNRAVDRFCNNCGSVLPPVSHLAAPLAGAHAAPLAGQTVPPHLPPRAGPTLPPEAAKNPLRCVLGHRIADGAHFCAEGHPLALDVLHIGRSYAQAGATPVPPSSVRFPSPAGFNLHTPVSPGHPAMKAPRLPIPPAVPAVLPPVPHAAPATGPLATPGVLRGFLVPLQGRPTQEYWALHGQSATVGRANTGDHVDVAVLDSTTSSRHAAIHFDTSRAIAFLEDLGSTNGTFVNDVPIGHNGRRELRDNDRVRFGGFIALLKLLPLV